MLLLCFLFRCTQSITSQNVTGTLATAADVTASPPLLIAAVGGTIALTLTQSASGNKVSVGVPAPSDSCG